MKLLKLAKRADLFLGIVCLGLLGYSIFKADYLMSGVWFVSAALSFISAKYTPAQWVAKKMLLMRLK